MATFLAGLTDEILPPLLYKPDYNLQFNELNIGTQKYNLYKDQLERLWADYFNSPLTNFKNVEEREKIKKDVEEKLTKFAGLNFADIKVNEGIKGLINTVGAKKHIINDIAFTRKVNEFNTTLDLLKLSPGTKENNYLTYHPDQSVELDRQVREFASLKDDNAIANYKFRDPIHKNYEKIVEDYIKDSGFKVKSVEVVEGGYYDDKGNFVPIQGKNLLGENIKDLMIVETKNGAYTIPEFHKMMEDYLVNNHGYGDYIAWKTDAELHKDLIGVFRTNDYMSLRSKDDILKAKWLLMTDKIDKEHSEYSETSRSYLDIYDKLNKRKNYLDYQIADIEKKIENKQFSFKDIVELENLRQQHNTIKEKILSVGAVNDEVKNRKNYIDVLKDAKDIDEYKFEALKSAYNDMKLFNSINNMARTHAMLTMEQSVKESDFQSKRLGLKPSGGGGGIDNTQRGEEINVEYDVGNLGSTQGAAGVSSWHDITKLRTPDSFIQKVDVDPAEFKQIIQRSPLVRTTVEGKTLQDIFGIDPKTLEVDFNSSAKNTYNIVRTADMKSPHFVKYHVGINHYENNIPTSKYKTYKNIIEIDTNDQEYGVHHFVVSNEVDDKRKSSTKQLTIFRKPENVSATLRSDYRVNTPDMAIKDSVSNDIHTQKLEINIDELKNKHLDFNNTAIIVRKSNNEVLDVRQLLGKEIPNSGKLILGFVPELNPNDGSVNYALNVTHYDSNGKRVFYKDINSEQVANLKTNKDEQKNTGTTQ